MGWFSQGWWVLPNAHSRYRAGVAGCSATTWQLFPSHHSLGRCCTMVFLSSELPGELWLTQSRVQGCLAGKDSVPSIPTLCLSAAQPGSRGGHGAGVSYRLALPLSPECHWHSNDSWWQRNRTHWVPIQVFLVWENLPGHYSTDEVSQWSLQWKFCLLRTIALWVLNPLQEPCCCLKSELGFSHGAGK